MSHSGSFLRIFRNLIIASHDNAILPGPEQHGEYSLTGLAVQNRCLRNGPVYAAIRRMKHSRRWPAGSEPDIFLAEGGNAGAAGGKSSFTGQSGRHVLDSYWIPTRAVS